MGILPAFAAAAAVLQLSVMAETFAQPPVFQDLPDVDLIRVEDTFYYSSSTFHYSPGAPILRSYDLVNWEYLSHSLPTFEFDDPKFNLTEGRAYNDGVYASSLRYHKSQNKFYWVGCMQGHGRTYIYTAPEIDGPWVKASTIIDYCLYDAGLLIDDDNTIYVASGKWTPNGAESQTWIAALNENLQVERQESVFQSNEELGYIEGARFYKINGTYFLWLTNPGVGRGQIMLRSSGDVWGPYDSWHRVLANNGAPIEGSGAPHQGALVDTSDGQYWYMAFVELGTSGRFPVLAPLEWDEDGWPNVVFDENGHWKSSYDYPLPRRDVEPIEGRFEFADSKIPARFEWNHNPDNEKWLTGHDGLMLHTATVTDDFFAARNTLTHRILGPQSNVTIDLDYSSMADGDRAGLATLRYNAGWIGVAKDGNSTTVQMVDHVEMDPSNDFVTVSKGDVIAEEPILGDRIWLRCQISTKSPNLSIFSYSTDGETFIELGQAHETQQGAVWFTGTRHGIFNFATKNHGGYVVVKAFDIHLH
ncbi:putative endo xylanase [Stachybotrys elegans]|uniref:Endo xylanase n=1 Tax=Stachybotrys elegans TaxID=80388 RepID=A0A8K0SHF0_9HYPO|nr:putative endo xylanase [Stachybotrys elegans]